MKVDNQVPQPIPTGPSSSPASASGASLQEGQIYPAQVRSLTRNEAEIKIGDQTIRVQIEGKMPQGEYIAIKVKSLQGKLPVVKLVADTPRGHRTGPDPAGILRSLGFKPTPELIPATRVLLDQGIPLNREVVGQLAAFLDTAPGTPAQKLTTIQAVVNKQLPVTMNHLQPVHTALHGPGPAELLAALAGLEPQSGQHHPAQAAPTPADSPTGPTGPTSHTPAPAAETGKQSMAGRDLQAQAA
ncbi:MAG: hypothetical protein PHC60_07025, partial [Heliobacteriaceae bacterium]|nr:hypothetical protein [Heliobacteriaceae bacterium]